MANRRSGCSRSARSWYGTLVDAATNSRCAAYAPYKESGPRCVAVPPITEINPRTVYSGNLGTLTGIQAGADIKKMELEFAQLSAKIKDLQKKEEVPTLTLPPLSQPSGSLTPPEKKEPSRIVVMAVRGADGILSATLRTQKGTHIVKVGEIIPGFGKVQFISRERVVVNGSAVPWM